MKRQSKAYILGSQCGNAEKILCNKQTMHSLAAFIHHRCISKQVGSFENSTNSFVPNDHQPNWTGTIIQRWEGRQIVYKLLCAGAQCDTKRAWIDFGESRIRVNCNNKIKLWFRNWGRKRKLDNNFDNELMKIKPKSLRKQKVEHRLNERVRSKVNSKFTTKYIYSLPKVDCKAHLKYQDSSSTLQYCNF